MCCEICRPIDRIFLAAELNEKKFILFSSFTLIIRTLHEAERPDSGKANPQNLPPFPTHSTFYYITKNVFRNGVVARISSWNKPTLREGVNGEIIGVADCWMSFARLSIRIMAGLIQTLWLHSSIRVPTNRHITSVRQSL